MPPARNHSGGHRCRDCQRGPSVLKFRPSWSPAPAGDDPHARCRRRHRSPCWRRSREHGSPGTTSSFDPSPLLQPITHATHLFLIGDGRSIPSHHRLRGIAQNQILAEGARSLGTLSIARTACWHSAGRRQSVLASRWGRGPTPRHAIRPDRRPGPSRRQEVGIRLSERPLERGDRRDRGRGPVGTIPRPLMALDDCRDSVRRLPALGGDGGSSGLCFMSCVAVR